MDYQSLFARTPAWRNSGDGAEHVLFTLDNMSVELMAPMRRRGLRVNSRRARGAGEGLASLVSASATSQRCIGGSARLGLDAGGPSPKSTSRDAAQGEGGSAPAPPPMEWRGCFSSNWPRSVRSRREPAGSAITGDGSCGHTDGRCRSARRRSLARGSGSTWRLDRTRSGVGLAADVLPLRRPRVEIAHPLGKPAEGGQEPSRQASRYMLARRRHRRHPCTADGC